MKKFRVVYETGWRGWGYDGTTTERIIEAKDFEAAFYKAKSKDWGYETCARIVLLEELIEEMAVD